MTQPKSGPAHKGTLRDRIRLARHVLRGGPVAYRVRAIFPEVQVVPNETTLVLQCALHNAPLVDDDIADHIHAVAQEIVRLTEPGVRFLELDRSPRYALDSPQPKPEGIAYHTAEGPAYENRPSDDPDEVYIWGDDGKARRA